MCRVCGTLVSLAVLSDEQLTVHDDETAFYGKEYWLKHQTVDLGFPDIYTRARNDLAERNLHWLKALLNYRLPPAKVMELGCSHGSFVALLNQAGYDTFGVEMSPWVVEFGQKNFGVPILIGPVETLEIAPGSLDIIALMDVLEHLPDPVATMAHCLQLLKPDGLLIIQTPQFKKEMDYADMVENKASFLEMLIPDEHIFLFSEHSVTRLFQQLGAEHIQFEPAIFSHYDMFFMVSIEPLASNSISEIEAALTASPNGRLVLALLDVYVHEFGRIPQLESEKDHLIVQLQASEADRSARLEVIESQGQQLEQIPQLEAQLQASKSILAHLDQNLWVKIGYKLRLITSKK